MFENIRVTTACAYVSAFPAIRLHGYEETNDSSVRFDCALNMDCNAKNLLSIAVPERTECIAKLTNCYLQAFRHAKNQGYESLALPILDTCLPVLQKRFSEI